MLSLFRTNQQVFGFLFFLYAAVLRAPVFWGAYLPAGEQVGVLGRWFETLVSQWGGLASGLIGIALVGSLGFLAMVFTFRYRVGPKTNLFPGVFTVLVASLLPTFLAANSFQVANICLALSLLALARTYRTPAAADAIFNAGWWIGVAALFVPQYFFFLVLAITGMNSLRAFRFREQLIVIIGTLLPLVLVGFYHFWYDRFAYFWQEQITTPFAVLAPFHTPFSFLDYIGGGLFALLLLIVLFNYNRYTFKTTMEDRKRINLFYWALLAAAIGMFFITPVTLLNWQVLVLPLGLLLSFNFSLLSRGIAEVWHLLLVVVVLALGIMTVTGLF